MSMRPRKKWSSWILIAIVLLVGVVLMSVYNAFTGLPDNSNRRPSQVISDSDSRNSHLASLHAERLEEHPGQNGIVELPDGRGAFVARAILARDAEKSIDTQYYMWHQDTVGRLLIYELLNAADRGVRVRLLVDDMYGIDGQDTWLAMDAHPQIEVRLFAPYSRKQPKYLQFLTRFQDVNARMHTKTFTVDNQATVVGGRNIGDEYFDADPKIAFADNDVLAIGPVVNQVSSEFNEYWNSDYAYPVSTLMPAGTEDDLNQLRSEAGDFNARNTTSTYLVAAKDSALADNLHAGTLPFSWGPGIIIHDSWRKRDQEYTGWRDDLLITKLKPHLEEAEHELIIISPYFVPEQEATDAFCRLAAKGVSVKILTNSLASNDVAAVHAGYSKFRVPLLHCGVELYELDEYLKFAKRRAFTWLPGLSKSSLHAKTMIIDKEKMFVGSFNFDQRSLYLNTEIGLVFEQNDIAGHAADKFDNNIEKIAFRVELVTDDNGERSLRWHSFEDGKQASFDKEPYVGMRTRITVWFLRLLPIDWLL